MNEQEPKRPVHELSKEELIRHLGRISSLYPDAADSIISETTRRYIGSDSDRFENLIQAAMGTEQSRSDEGV